MCWAMRSYGRSGGKIDLIPFEKKSVNHWKGTRMEYKVPIQEKYALTVDEMAAYTNIGQKKLHWVITEYKDADFLLRIGNKTLFKRTAFTQFLDKAECL